MPLTLGRSLHIHPLVTVLMIFIGGALSGVAGLMLVLPLLPAPGGARHCRSGRHGPCASGLAQDRPVFRIVVAQEGFMQLAHLAALRGLDDFRILGHLVQRVLAVWYMVVAIAIGVGVKVCTWSRLKLFFFSHSARFSMSSSVEPGWAAMK
jgi:hypothetical protein